MTAAVPEPFHREQARPHGARIVHGHSISARRQGTGANRVHLADAWCGMCGVLPRDKRRRCETAAVELRKTLPGSVAPGRWIAVVTGAGEADRCIPPRVSHWIREFLAQAQDGQVVLIRLGEGERETAQAILGFSSDIAPRSRMGCDWSYNISQLMRVLQQCHWVIGADTGPLHLGTLAGARALGWYFRVPECTKPVPMVKGIGSISMLHSSTASTLADHESIALMCGTRVVVPDWGLRRSRMDRWGAYLMMAPERSRRELARRHLASLCTVPFGRIDGGMICFHDNPNRPLHAGISRQR